MEIIILSVIGLVVVVVIIAIKLQQEENTPVREHIGTVVAKRQDVFGGRYAGSFYFVTFEFADKTRRELALSGKSYGLLVEGDHGVVETKGTTFRGFRRFS